MNTAPNALSLAAPALAKVVTKLRINDPHFASLYAEYQQLEAELPGAAVGVDIDAKQIRHAELMRKLTIMAQAEKENGCCGGCGCGG